MKHIAFTELVLIAVASSPTVYAHGSKAEIVDHMATMDVAMEQKPCGIAGDAGQVSRTIDVSMMDSMKFQLSTLKFRKVRPFDLLQSSMGKYCTNLCWRSTGTNDKHAKMSVSFLG